MWWDSHWARVDRQKLHRNPNAVLGTIRKVKTWLLKGLWEQSANSQVQVTSIASWEREVILSVWRRLEEWQHRMWSQKYSGSEKQHTGQCLPHRGLSIKVCLVNDIMAHSSWSSAKSSKVATHLQGYDYIFVAGSSAASSTAFQRGISTYYEGQQEAFWESLLTGKSQFLRDHASRTR